MANENIGQRNEEKLRARLLDEIAGTLLPQSEKSKLGDSAKPEDRLKEAIDLRTKSVVTGSVAESLRLDETRERTVGEHLKARDADFATRQELKMKELMEAADKARRAETRASLTLFASIFVGVAGSLGWFAWQSLNTVATGEAVEAAETKAKETAELALKEIGAEDKLRQDSIDSAQRAQAAAIAAQTTADIVLGNTQSALAKAEALLADVQGKSDILDELNDAESANQFIQNALVQPETVELVANELDKTIRPFMVPPGAILAMPDRDGRECPEHWTQFAPAIGRFIVGAGDPTDSQYPEGLSERRVWSEKTVADDKRTLGGVETVKLEPEQMPSHDHNVNDPGHNHMDRSIANGADNADTGYPEILGTLSNEMPSFLSETGITIDATGENNAHQNMPPYIALYWCKKD